MERKSGIYRILNVRDGKSYIGQSIDVRRRQQNHFSALKRGASHNRHLQRAYNKYGAESFVFDVLEYCSPSELDEREIYYISLYESDSKGYNAAPGGKDTSNYEARLSNVSRTWQTNKRRVVLCNTGEVFASATDASRQLGIAGPTIVSCCTRHRLSAGKGADGSPLVWMYYDEWERICKSEVDEIIRVATKGSGRAVICLNTMTVYSSVHEASRTTGVDRKSMVECCRGKVRHAGKNAETGAGFVWMYHDNYLALSSAEQSARHEASLEKIYNHRARQVKCLNNNVIFPSATEAGKYAGVNWSAIAACCAGKVSGAGTDPHTGEHLRWEYVASAP